MIVLGLSKEDLEKPTITEVAEVHVHDGKGGSAVVRKGDKVSPKDYSKFLMEHLGPWPYEVTWTAQWRCGMGYCQVKSNSGETMGINASELTIALF